MIKKLSIPLRLLEEKGNTKIVKRQGTPSLLWKFFLTCPHRLKEGWTADSAVLCTSLTRDW